MHDVIVVGAGNAALAAAVAAREAGAARVLVLAKAPEPLRGGNTHYSGGLLRFAFDRAEDLLPIVPTVEKPVPGFMSTRWEPIPGLYACGEMVGGLFHTNYPGGTGLMSGAVFGRLAGSHAAGASAAG